MPAFLVGAETSSVWCKRKSNLPNSHGEDTDYGGIIQVVVFSL